MPAQTMPTSIELLIIIFSALVILSILTIKLSVNGKFVNGITRSTQKKGYFCLESEGGEIHFRNMRILELPPGVQLPSDGAGLDGLARLERDAPPPQGAA